MKLLLAHDGSTDAQAALAMLTNWKPRAGDTVRVLVVIPTTPVLGTELQPPGSAHPPSLSDVAELITADATARLRKAGYRTADETRIGNPADEILRAAGRAKSDAIVVGAKGVGRVRRFLLGSVAQRVAQHAPCSVLVVRPPAPGRRPILVAADGSPAAEAAVTTLIALPWQRPTEVQVLAVQPPPESVLWGRHPEVHMRARALRHEVGLEQKQAATSCCRAVMDRLADAGFVATPAVVRGRAGTEIVEAARRLGAGLIAIGARSHADAAKPGLGGVASDVLNDAGCSVLIGRAH
jgi:nucleotide-binding universal stress UspA family protein